MRSLTIAIVLSAIALAALSACPDQQYAAGARLFSQVNPSGLVTIPAGETWIFDLANSPLYDGVRVYGRLVFAEQNVMMHSYDVTVFSGGEFLIGSCDCPYKSKARIELHIGADVDFNPNGVGSKVIGVLPGGRLEFYGEVNGPTWTQLSADVAVGATQLRLLQPVQWKAGDDIVIAGTGFVNSWYGSENTWEQTEERKVQSVSADGLTVTIDRGLGFAHMGRSIQTVDIRAEVGSLTRNIVVQGDATSDASKIGAHMMFMAGSTIQLKGVEVTRAGQQGKLGRYPIHYHLFGNASGLNVDDCSIHHNYQRCLTIHGAHYLTVQRNVAYRTYGHCFFLEDGIETNNYIAYNLAMVTFKMNENLLPGIMSDDEPALFWITHPTNHYIHNHAVSSPMHCFWFALPLFPLGPSHTKDIIPRQAPLGRFEHNTAHGCGGNCMHIDTPPDQRLGQPGADDGALNRIQTNDKDGNMVDHYIGTAYTPYTTQNRLGFLAGGRSVANYESFTTYRCGDHGIWARYGPHHFKNYKSAGNRIGITIACHAYCEVSDSTFVGSIDEDELGDYPIRGYEVHFF